MLGLAIFIEIIQSQLLACPLQDKINFPLSFFFYLISTPHLT